MRNASLKFICKDVNLKVEQNNNPFLKKYKLYNQRNIIIFLNIKKSFLRFHDS